VTSNMPLQAAMKRPLTPGAFIEQFSRLGGTEFELGEVQFDVLGEVMVPLSELNRMRRDLIAAWTEGAVTAAPVEAVTATLESLMPSRGTPDDSPLQLHALCRTQAHVDAALVLGVPRLYLDFEDIRLYADLVKQIKARSDTAQVWLATPRIQKSGEAGFFKLIQRAEPHGVLIRNLGAMSFFKDAGIPMTGDFSLNVANPLTAEILKKSGLERLTISYDLNIEQVVDLLGAAPPSWFEVTLHQHMPMFHMEHCVFAAFLSKGTDFTNCGRPCDKHRVHLKDRVGMHHPLKADVGCRNTLFNAVAQTGAQFFDELREHGLRCFRVELLEENADEAMIVLRTYQELMSGQRDGDEIWRDLKAQSQLGVTRGTLTELA
jgi:putative protease